MANPINNILRDVFSPAVEQAVAERRRKAQLTAAERKTLLEVAVLGDGSLLLDCIDDLLTIRHIDGDLAATRPLVSVGPSGIGGEYQSEIHPDRVTEADLAADRAIVRSGRATPEQLGLLKLLATKAVGGAHEGWQRFEAEVDRVIASVNKWRHP